MVAVKQETTVQPLNVATPTPDAIHSTGGDLTRKPVVRYKRPRSSRACVTCHDRKVKCDSQFKFPCTNCVSFNCECVLPPAKRVRRTRKQIMEEKLKKDSSGSSNENIAANGDDDDDENDSVTSSNIEESGLKKESNVSQKAQTWEETFSAIDLKANNPNIIKRLKDEKVDVLYLGSSVALNKSAHYRRFPEEKDKELDDVDLQVLEIKGCFKLPPKKICQELIDLYFLRVHPFMPVLNRTEFMATYYEHPENAASLLLLNAVLMAGSKYATDPLYVDEKGSTHKTSRMFYRRARTWYTYNLGNRPIELLQASLILGWYWEGPEDVTQNVFFWTRTAITYAAGYGFHKANNALSEQDAKMWRRCWWVIFSRDRIVALSFGRSIVIDLEDCDVPMLSIDDFDESEAPDRPSPYNLSMVQRQYIIHYIKISEIIGIVLKAKYTVQAEKVWDHNHLSFVKRCDMMMVNWLNNLPEELQYSITDPSKQHMYSSLIMCLYYMTLTLIHKTNILRRSFQKSTDEDYYPSWGITFQSSHMIIIILKNLMDRHELRHCPSITISALFSASIMMIYHIDNKNAKVSATAKKLLDVCSKAFVEVSKQWEIGHLCLQMAEVLRNNKAKRDIIIQNTLVNVAHKANEKIEKHYAEAEPQLNKAVGDLKDFKPSQLFPRINAGNNGGSAGPITVTNTNTTATTPAASQSPAALNDYSSHGPETILQESFHSAATPPTYPILQNHQLTPSNIRGSPVEYSRTTSASPPAHAASAGVNIAMSNKVETNANSTLSESRSSSTLGPDLYDMQYYDLENHEFDIINDPVKDMINNNANNGLDGVASAGLSYDGAIGMPSDSHNEQPQQQQQHVQAVAPAEGNMLFNEDDMMNQGSVPMSLNIGDWFNFLQY